MTAIRDQRQAEPDLPGELDREPATRSAALPRPYTRPSNLLYAVDESPPAARLMLLGLQFAVMAATCLVLVAIIVKHAKAQPDAGIATLAAACLGFAIGTAFQALPKARSARAISRLQCSRRFTWRFRCWPQKSAVSPRDRHDDLYRRGRGLGRDSMRLGVIGMRGAASRVLGGQPVPGSEPFAPWSG